MTSLIHHSSSGPLSLSRPDPPSPKSPAAQSFYSYSSDNSSDDQLSPKSSGPYTPDSRLSLEHSHHPAATEYELHDHQPAAFDGRRRRPVYPYIDPRNAAYLKSWIATRDPTEKLLQPNRIFCVPLPELDESPVFPVDYYYPSSPSPRRRSDGAAIRRPRRLLTSPTTPKTSITRKMADEAISSSTGAPVPAEADTPSELSYSKTASSNGSYPSADSLSEYERDNKSTTSTHFEDLTLAENDANQQDCNVKAESRPTLKRRTTPGIGEVRRSTATLPLASPRENDPPRFPNPRSAPLNGHGYGNGILRDQSLGLPHARPMRRGFSSPSMPMLAMRSGSFGIVSRSPSPGSRSVTSNGSVSSPQLPNGTTPRPSWESRPMKSRQNSWQPGRKTVEELEAEYNDEDEDVPDEAILENVPITPVPGMPSPLTQYRVKTPSPHRRASYNNLNTAYGSLHSANVPKNAKRPSLPNGLPNGRLRRSKPPRLVHSASMSNFPSEPIGYKHRSKSWSEDLNEEARQLSMALEEYAADRSSDEKRHSGRSEKSSTSTPGTPPRPNIAKLRSKTSILELQMPPMQKGSIMIDPLPISKEKEAVLTRTRPSWLPPKCQKEERKHMKEWEQMMARAQEAEKKRISREKEQMETKQELEGSLARIWDQHVLPNWDKVIHEPRTRELWWRGVTPRSRAQVWLKALGNDLALTPASFAAALRRADELEESLADMPEEERAHSTEAAWLKAIDRDVPTVLPDQQIYQRTGPLHTVLTQVLRAYALYRRDVGYVYGTHLIAGLLCLHLRAADAFIALANLLNRPLPLAFLVHDSAAMSRTYSLVMQTLKSKHPSLHTHLTSSAVRLSPSDFLEPMFRTLFSRNMLPGHASRVWDLFVFEGDRVLIRAAVAVLARLEHRLYGDREAVLDILGWSNSKVWELGDEESFVKAIRDVGKSDKSDEGKKGESKVEVVETK